MVGMCSAGRGGHLVIIWAFEKGRVAGIHLEGSFTGNIRGTAPTRPGFWVEELAGVVRAVAQPWSVEAWARSVDLFGSVSLHKKVDGHYSSTL